LNVALLRWSLLRFVCHVVVVVVGSFPVTFTFRLVVRLRSLRHWFLLVLVRLLVVVVRWFVLVRCLVWFGCCAFIRLLFVHSAVVARFPRSYVVLFVVLIVQLRSPCSLLFPTLRSRYCICCSVLTFIRWYVVVTLLVVVDPG
jgi:hypothetical protein